MDVNKRARHGFRLLLLTVSLATRSVAHASTSPAAQAGEMLARAQALNAKCNYLSASMRIELADLVQKAEQVLTVRENVDVARAAIRRGHSSGIDADCSLQEKRNLFSILAAAKAAISGEILPALHKPSQNLSSAPVSGDPRSISLTQPPVTPARRADSVTSKVANKTGKPKSKGLLKVAGAVEVIAHSIRIVSKGTDSRESPARDDDLNANATMTRKYYVTQRCAASDVPGLTQMYGQIVSSHTALLQNHKPGEIALMLHRSERAARKQSC